MIPAFGSKMTKKISPAIGGEIAYGQISSVR
jgi:hypothetical protein